MDGLPLVKLLKGEGTWREGILLEGWPGRGIYSAVRTEKYVYVETQGDIPEFYDLQLDPFQINNVAADPKYQDLVAQHQTLLHQIEGLQPNPTP